MIKKYKKNILLSLLLSIFSMNYALSDDTPTVNILAWWDYFSHPWVEDYVYERCQANISYDEYYSNVEFLRRWRNNSQLYDIIIFTDTVYAGIKRDVDKDIGSLQEHVEKYNPAVRDNYIKQGYSPNTVYFYQSLMGVLWNPDNITVYPDDKAKDIFSKTRDKKVMLINDPYMVESLLYDYLVDVDLLNKDDDLLTLDNFKKMIQGSEVYAGNSLSPLYVDDDFAAAYIWSGQAFELIEHFNEQQTYQFLVNPSVSKVSSDMLSLINDTEPASCVATVLSSEEFLTKLQNDTYYFSPYTKKGDSNSEYYHEIYQYYIDELPNLRWADVAPKCDLLATNNNWQSILRYIQQLGT